MFTLRVSTIRLIAKSEAQIRAKATETTSSPQKVSKPSNVCIEKTEAALSKWIEDMTLRKIQLSFSLIRNKALLLYDHFFESDEEKDKEKNFSPSQDWFQDFKNRFNLIDLKLTGESTSSNQV